MFWTIHKDAAKHSLLRAVSGGPIYVSDRPGATDPEILKPLIYKDGEILMMDRSAKPTEDSAFFNPLEDGVLKLQNISDYGDKKAGGIAVFNLTDKEQMLSFCPSDIPDIEQAESYWVYDYFSRKAFPLQWNENHAESMEANGYKWFVILPGGKISSCLGLLDKYVGFTAVEHVCESENKMLAVIRKSGRVGWISEKIPSSVIINGKDYTDKYEKIGNIYITDIPEENTKMILSVSWDNTSTAAHGN